jgi:hypothetical protein
MFKIQHASCYKHDGVSFKGIIGRVDILFKEPTNRMLYIEDDDGNTVVLNDEQIIELIDYLKKIYKGSFDIN